MTTSSLTPLLLASIIFVFKACLVVMALLFVRVFVWLFNLVVLAPLFDPLRKVPGPPGGRFDSHFMQVMDPDVSSKTHEDWISRYGKSISFHGFAGFDTRLISFDFRAINHVLNSSVYEKPWQTRTMLTRLFGRGIFAMEGAEHRFQRKIIGPAFTTQAIKGYQPIFLRKALELRDKWSSILPSSPPGGASESGVTIDVLHWATRAAFDIIGLAGLNYDFHAVREEDEEIYLSYRRMFDVSKAPSLWALFTMYVPVLYTIWPDKEAKAIKECVGAIKRSGKLLVQERKEAMVLEKNSGIQSTEDAKDVLSLLVKSNLNEDPTRRMSDSDLIDQVISLVFGGSDTSALALSSALRLLAENADCQTRLRDELVCAFPERDSLDTLHLSCSRTPDGSLSFDIDSLAYLDGVVRETLRLAPPVHGTIRAAMRDDSIPLAEPVVLADGEIVRAIEIRKGSYVHIPIEGLNYSRALYGPEALTFAPSRWLESSGGHPGHLGTMTFSLGPHSCPGFRFSFWEIKFVLAVLVRSFVFARGPEVLGFSNQVLTRPYIRGQWSKGVQLPLIVSGYEG